MVTKSQADLEAISRRFRSARAFLLFRRRFRTAAAAFSVEVRTRMETALREAAVATAAPTPGAAGSSARTVAVEKPKIALKMDFSAFGKK